jgi:hypothetical protein
MERHVNYYIDDGCYGPCIKQAWEIRPCPCPCFRGHPLKTSEARSTDAPITVYPTCDGLDRVCRDIPLPCLQRDDCGLPNLGCSSSEGLGTAFNGFDPPDTVYCVLGYFSLANMAYLKRRLTRLNVFK